MAMHTVQTITGITFEQLRTQAEKVRMRRLPDRTLRHWLQQLPISRDADGMFDQEDVQIVCDLARWLRNPNNTIDQFVTQLIQEYSNAN
jgi:alpha-L-fucosidase